MCLLEISNRKKITQLQYNLKQSLVLVVDDDEDNLELLVQLLQFVECSFITAEDGETAITLAQNYHPNLILLDMMLPGISGVEVVKSLQQNPRTKDIPIVAVTAIARAESQQRFLEGGCLECVTKPYSIDELENIIRF
ncbi:response regulator [Chroococcidiopsis sp [FACHB-1243]]|uniref:response regulator n=1 Tax=Chroococcidiopsis sp. [FACHB-1243] TaxID=2692781 RepID=UPI0018F017B7|nr:response regulator [Chroococcidiopsis sp. [FACHB-1243]]